MKPPTSPPPTPLEIADWLENVGNGCHDYRYNRAAIVMREQAAKVAACEALFARWMTPPQHNSIECAGIPWTPPHAVELARALGKPSR